VRGEHRDSSGAPHGEAGPSPRAWGAQRIQRISQILRRTIPTCVGSTEQPRSLSVHSPDHPHVRGEHRTVFDPNWENAGPSPRAWGAPSSRLRGGGHERTIPTCVGSTSAPPSCCGRATDHPHVRGEHGATLPGGWTTRGPSPRAWGARDGGAACRAGRRTIPTCVGSTSPSTSTAPSRSDHPHVRGEHDVADRRVSFRCGPSPRAWGARVPTGPRRRPARTIPTCVGSTGGLGVGGGGRSDHPHVRGEHRLGRQRQAGVPDHPHVRGEHA